MCDHLLILLIRMEEIDTAAHQLYDDRGGDKSHAMELSIPGELVKLGFLGVALCLGLFDDRTDIILIDADEFVAIDDIPLLHAEIS